jgi:mRNA interferase MazF
VPLKYPPDRGEVLIGDFEGLRTHEMEKLRPCIVLSPRIDQRSRLATVVCLSTTFPDPIQDYHVELAFDPIFCERFPSPTMWVKVDMVYSVSLDRLSRQREKLPNGDRTYTIRLLNYVDLQKVLRCVLNGIGFKVDENLNRM